MFYRVIDREREVIEMLCNRCKMKTTTRKQVSITCKKCGQEAYVPLYNNNVCKTCNEKAGTYKLTHRKREHPLQDRVRLRRWTDVQPGHDKLYLRRRRMA